MFNLFFLNDANETEHYGTFTTRDEAEAVIAQVRKDFGPEGFETERFTITQGA